MKPIARLTAFFARARTFARTGDTLFALAISIWALVLASTAGHRLGLSLALVLIAWLVVTNIALIVVSLQLRMTRTPESSRATDSADGANAH